jgi:hypothetical protein
MESVSKVVDHGTKGTIGGSSTVSVITFPDPAHPLSKRKQKMSATDFLSTDLSYISRIEKGFQVLEPMMDFHHGRLLESNNYSESLILRSYSILRKTLWLL